MALYVFNDESELQEFIINYKHETGSLPSINHTDLVYPYLHTEYELILEFDPLYFNNTSENDEIKKVGTTKTKIIKMRNRYMRRRIRNKMKACRNAFIMSTIMNRQRYRLDDIDTCIGYLSANGCLFVIMSE